MSEDSKIEWTNHTFNPWWGCTKVHSGCANCYAETLDARWGGDHWGKNPRRMVLGEWGKPAKWDREARESGRIDRVFCASMCDLFEDYDGPVHDQQGKPVPMRGLIGNWTVPLLRRRTLGMIHETPNLDWLLLSKRPENMVQMCTDAWGGAPYWPANVMFGTSPCNQATAEESIPHLLRVPGRRFLSCEPLLGPIDFEKLPRPEHFHHQPRGWSAWWLTQIHWTIVGCESNGKNAGRFADGYEAAARGIIRQCEAAGVPVFHKQMPIDGKKSGNMAEWRIDLRVRQYPAFTEAKA